MCVELWELRSNGAIRISSDGQNTFDHHIIIIEKQSELLCVGDQLMIDHGVMLLFTVTVLA